MGHDVIIVGSGQAGVPLAHRLAGAGKRVLLVERGELGGTCVNTGCTPTKTVIASARAAHVARTAGRLGVRVGDVEVDLNAVVERKNQIVSRWREGVQKGVEGAEHLTVLKGHGRLAVGPAVEVDGVRHQAPIVILNVGARPSIPRVAGLDSVPWVNNAGLLDVRERPEHLLVLGGGYIGCELGQAQRRFGAQVTLIDHHSHLLSREDPDVSEVLEAAFRKEQISLELGKKVLSVAPSGKGVAVQLEGGRSVTGSLLLVATGRRPNTDDLGCEVVGLRLDTHGYVEVDDQYRTNVPGIFALGDCTPQPQFTHTSWDDHRVLFNILKGAPSRRRSSRHVPYTVFTDPQVAGVGLSESEARKRGVKFELAKMDFGDIARAAEVDETAGIMKLLLDPATERILGVTLVGAEAGELLHVFVGLMQAEAKASAIVDAEFVHPTFAEGLQSLVMRLPRYALS